MAKISKIISPEHLQHSQPLVNFMPHPCMNCLLCPMRPEHFLSGWQICHRLSTISRHMVASLSSSFVSAQKVHFALFSTRPRTKTCEILNLLSCLFLKSLLFSLKHLRFMTTVVCPLKTNYCFRFKLKKKYQRKI